MIATEVSRDTLAGDTLAGDTPVLGQAIPEPHLEPAVVVASPTQRDSRGASRRSSAPRPDTAFGRESSGFPSPPDARSRASTPPSQIGLHDEANPPPLFAPGTEPSVTGHGGGSQPGAGVKVEPGSTYFKVGRMRNLVNAAYLEEYGRLSVRLSCKKSTFETATVSGTTTPEWNEECAFKLDRWEELAVELLDRDWGMRQVLGRAVLTLQRPRGRDRLWVPLLDPDSSKHRGDLLFLMGSAPIPDPSLHSDDGIEPFRPAGFNFVIGVVVARDLPRCDPAVALTVGGVGHRTVVGGKGVTLAAWDEDLTFPRRVGTVTVAVMDERAIRSDEPLGVGSVPADEIERQGTWVPIKNKRGRPVGEVLLQAGGVRRKLLAGVDLSAFPPAPTPATAVVGRSESFSSVSSSGSSGTRRSGRSAREGDAGRLSVKVIAGSDIHEAGPKYIRLSVNGRSSRKTKPLDEECCVWGEEFDLPACRRDTLHVDLMRKGFAEDRLLGSARMPIAELTGADTVVVPLTHHGRPVANLTLDYGFQPASASGPGPSLGDLTAEDLHLLGGTLAASTAGSGRDTRRTTISGRSPTRPAPGLPDDGSDPTPGSSRPPTPPPPEVKEVQVVSTDALPKRCKPYVVLEVGSLADHGAKRATKVLKRTDHPAWQESFPLHVEEGDVLNVTLMRRHRLWRDSVLGNGRVPGAVLAGKEEHSVPLSLKGHVVSNLHLKVVRAPRPTRDPPASQQRG
eukprot:EG_transcript_3574